MSSLEDFNIKYDLKKHVCPFCDFRTHKKYNLEVHKTNKHQNSNQLHRPWDQIIQTQRQNPSLPNHSQLKTSHLESNPHQNSLEAQNQYLQNKVNELQGGNSFHNNL